MELVKYDHLILKAQSHWPLKAFGIPCTQKKLTFCSHNSKCKKSGRNLLHRIIKKQYASVTYSSKKGSRGPRWL